jgi:uncharacterized protein
MERVVTGRTLFYLFDERIREISRFPLKKTAAIGCPLDTPRPTSDCATRLQLRVALPRPRVIVPAMPPSPSRPRPRASVPFHVMTKPIGPRCNLDCTYCFYLEKEQLYPGTKNFRMSDDVLERYIQDYIAAQPGLEVHFAWQGGEPTLLGLGFFEQAVRLQQRYAGPRKIVNVLQTNGTLLNDEWGAFFARHGFLIGLSIDGPRELHDLYRVDRGQRPTFDRVMAGIECLKRHGVQFNTLTVVNRKNVEHPLAVYRFLREVGSGFQQYIPLVERDAPSANPYQLSLSPPPDSTATQEATAVTPWSVPPAAYGEFLVAIFDEWVRHDVGQTFVQLFDVTLSNWTGQGGGICVFSEKCGTALAVEHNGDVYACDHYVYPQHKLGNLQSEWLGDMVDSPRQRKFGDDKSATLPAYCRECDVRFACHGECPKHRFARTPSGEAGLNYLCPAYKRFFGHVRPAMDRMVALLKADQAPAEIMREMR